MPDKTLMKPDFKPRRKIEEGYYADIRQILSGFFDRQSGERLSNISAPEFLQKYAWQAAQRMIMGLLQDSGRTWREAASQSMQGQKFYRGLRAELHGSVGTQVRQLIAANARLIRSLPIKVAEQVNAKISESAYLGERSESFSSRLLSHFTKTHARLVARTETSKASTALTQARSEDLGLNWWVWQTSQDQRVRVSHRKMQGVLVSWSDLPSPELLAHENSYGHYAAGNIFNCRCYPEPVLYLDQISFPHRVYTGGRIRYVTRAEFRNIARIPIHQMEAA